MSSPLLTYVYDPLCGWCYGFHPVVEKLAGRFKGRLDIDVKPGGLAIGAQAQTISEGYPSIAEQSRRAEAVTGVSFGENFYLLAEERSLLLDSGPPSIAQTVVNKLAPDHALEFAGNLQNAFFKEGRNLNDWEVYEELFSPFPVDVSECKKWLESEEIKQETHRQFEWCRQNGADVFPALLLTIGDETGLMARGYRPYDTVESHLHHLLRNFEKLGQI